MDFFATLCPDANDRRGMILAAAYGAFCTYGFRRTSMDDIARAADISRPALYQHFANKGEIFNAAVAAFFDQMKVVFDDILASDRDPVSKLDALIEAAILEPHGAMVQTPHGAELLGLKNELAPELFDEIGAYCRAAYCQALAGSSIEKDLARDLSFMITEAFDGLKARSAGIEELKQARQRILRIVDNLT